jgi:endonuclease/exonuclease/phosphatase family metal-dependent hydrolase
VREEEILITLSANVAGPTKYGFPFRKKVARRVFETIDAHLIGFQEFTEECREVFNCHEHEFIMGDAANAVYNAIAYDKRRLQLLKSETLWLSPNGKHGKAWDAMAERTAHWAIFMDKNTETPLVFINTQLDNAGYQARAEGTRLILNLIESMFDKRAAIIFSGDFNMSVGRPHHNWPPSSQEPYEAVLAAGFIDAWIYPQPYRGRQRTFHHFQGEGCGEDPYGTFNPDHVFVLNAHVHNCMLIRDSYGGVMPSDHYWLLTHVGPEVD